MRVLVVDDSPMDQAVAKAMLAPDEHDVLVAGTLAQATQLGGPAPDVVLLDLNLPDSSGIATLRSFFDWAPDTPVVVVTGTDRPDQAIEAIEAGCDDYLVKGSFGPADLGRAIRFARARRTSGRASLEQHIMNDIAHRLATPITTIQIDLHLLTRAGSESVDLQRLARNCERLLLTIHAMVDKADAPENAPAEPSPA